MIWMHIVDLGRDGFLVGVVIVVLFSSFLGRRFVFGGVQWR